jgi:hypothetical protein
MYEELLKQVSIERAKRQAKRQQEWATYHASLPKPATPDEFKRQPVEYRDWIHKRIKELLD